MTDVPNTDTPVDAVLAPPTTWMGTIKHLGPGLIIAGSIVGSGELVTTTKTGAQAGFSLLWLIIIGCIIKVFVQIEMGRHTITYGETSLQALNRVGGPRLGGINWILWFWLAMMFASLAQLGGIVGGVGQALAISFPFQGDYQTAVQTPTEDQVKWLLKWRDDAATGGKMMAAESPEDQARFGRAIQRLDGELAALGPQGTELVQTVKSGGKPKLATTWDDKIWAALITLLTIPMLVSGRYSIIQNLSTVMVAGFTFVTLGNVFALQWTKDWAISADQILRGLSFGLPTSGNGLATALATFGIIGVGASELIAYPYWCLEKGYARHTGPRDDSPAWAGRARGWLRVMTYDSLLSMVVYTVSTLAFYLLGAAVLHREGQDPDGMRMVAELASAYVPVFGEYAKLLFLFGAFAVLYSTFLVANAGHARTFADAFRFMGFYPQGDPVAYNKVVRVLGLVLPLICISAFLSGANPVKLILISGVMQALLLPMIGVGALLFRWKWIDPRLQPSKLWDVCLVVSFIGLLVAGLWIVWSKVGPMITG